MRLITSDQLLTARTAVRLHGPYRHLRTMQRAKAIYRWRYRARIAMMVLLGAGALALLLMAAGCEG